VHFGYDALNRRYLQTVENGSGTILSTVYYVNQGFRKDRGDAGDEIALRLDGTGSVISRYLHGSLVDEVLAEENIGSGGVRDVLWAMTDHQGSVRNLARVTAGTASVVNHIVYDAFGKTVSETDAAIAHLYGYTGRELDKETGLQYNRARYLDLVLARWISQDPISFGGGDANLYRYVSNHPTMATDPSGLYEDLPSDIVERLKELWTSPSQSWSQWWNGDTAYNDKIGSVMDELLMLSDNDPLVLQSLILEGGKNSSRNRYTRLLGLALVEKSIGLLSEQQGISFQAASEIMLARSREITGSYNYGTEMRLAAAYGSENGPMVAGVVIGMSLNPIRTASPNDIAFSQRTVNENVTKYVQDMKNNNWDWNKSGPVRVMWQGDRYVTFDNRRVMAAREAGVKQIPIEVVDPKAIRPGTKMTWEESFRRRYNDKRNKDAGGAVPHGGLMECPTIEVKPK
jgi:RHS repeat-associated protein